MEYVFDKSLQDGALSPDTGRIVIYPEQGYEPVGYKSVGKTRDHNDICIALASKYRLKRSDVVGNALRYYWKPMGKFIIISPVRQIDETWMYNNKKQFNEIIDELF